jgi:hypothetical protein
VRVGALRFTDNFVRLFSSPGATVGASSTRDTDMVWIWTDDDAVDIVVKRSSGLDDIAPWTSGENEAATET